MNIDEIIKTINDSSYDDDPGLHDVEAVTPEQKHERAERLAKRCDVSPDVVQALAEHIGALPDAEILPAIQRLTTEVERHRLVEVNRMLRNYEPFTSAMARLHAWRTANKQP